MGDYSESNYELRKPNIDNLCTCGNYIGVV